MGDLAREIWEWVSSLLLVIAGYEEIASEDGVAFNEAVSTAVLTIVAVTFIVAGGLVLLFFSLGEDD